MVRAWYMDDSSADQRLCHQLNPPKYVPSYELEKLGVLYFQFDPKTYEGDAKFKKLKADRGYTYQDICEISPSKLDNYELKIKSFYDEHIHTDEEIRFILDGSGYFDVRDLQNRWIRIEVSAGDLIILPAGIYHRFTLDTNNYIKALRLFVGEPIWTPYSRCQIDENHPSVKKYMETFAGDANAQSL